LLHDVLHKPLYVVHLYSAVESAVCRDMAAGFLYARTLACNVQHQAAHPESYTALCKQTALCFAVLDSLPQPVVIYKQSRKIFLTQAQQRLHARLLHRRYCTALLAGTGTSPLLKA
jgi:hypothetical protein